MLVYCTSFDHNGVGVASAYRNGDSDGGWDFGSDDGSDNDWTIIGDSVVSEPQIGFNNNTSPFGAYRIETPAWGARRGDYAFCADSVYIARVSFGGTAYTMNGQESPRLAIPGSTQTVRIIHVAFSCDLLPSVDKNQGMIFSLQDSGGNIRGYIGVNPSGRLVVYAGNDWTSTNDGDVATTPTVLATSSSPVITAETWYSLNIKITTNPTDANADIQVYVGDIIASNLVIDASAVALTDTTSGAFGVGTNIDILGLLPPSHAGQIGAGSVDAPDNTKRYMRDLVVCDTTGTYNNDLLGQVFVAAQEMRAEDAGGGWEAFTRSNISTGVINHQDAQTGIRVGDNANLELGSGDFTIEGFWRFNELPTGGADYTLASKWSEDDNNRSWHLYWDSTANEIVFDISTDGTAVTELIRYPWVPDTNKYYHIAINRDTAVIQLFINGTQLGVDIADANTYYNGSANLGLCSRWNSSNTLVTATAFKGFLDEFRLTVGLARYSVDFTPTTVPFGRNGVDDANFTSTELLVGADGGTIVDESDNAFTITVGTGVTADQPDDDNNSFEVLNRRPAWDDTYIEARNTFATTILTLTANPLDTETITLGSTTYTYKTTLSAGPTVANEILIGTDVAETLDHTIKAVNGGTGIGTEYSTGTVANTAVFASALPSPQALFTATSIGTAGNSVAATETLTNGSFSSGTTFAGGEDIPAPSDFAIERLPVDVTGVLGMQVTARGYKSDAGSAQLRFDLVGPSAGVGTGTAVGTDLNPAWLYQIFEEDPDTAATITPSTITGGRIRVTRTT